MMDPLDHDPIDDLVRAARPAAPPRLASAVTARLAARRSRRMATVGGASVLATAAVVMLWIHRTSDAPVATPVPPDEHRPALAWAVDAGMDSATIVPTDAATLDWTDMPALLADLERVNRAALAGCRADDGGQSLSGPALPTFRIERQADGTSRCDLVIHHSLGYLSYSAEERCLQKLGRSFALPLLPATLSSVAFTLAAPSSPTSGSAWLDPVHTAQDLLAPVRPRLEKCVHGARVPHAQQAVAVFEPGKGPTGRTAHLPARGSCSTAGRRAR